MKDGKLDKLNDIYQYYIMKQDLLSNCEIEDIVEKCEEVHNQYSKKWLSPNHNLEKYLFEYYFCKEDYNCTKYKMHEIYRTLAKKYCEANNLKSALQAFDNSLRWNPLDIDTRFEKAKLYRNIQELEKYKNVVEASYLFCYTTNDIARYYRYQGYYYLETYQPDLAEALYIHSNKYYKSEMADQEILFLKTALGKNKRNNSPYEMQKYITMAGIPLLPDKHTLQILWKVAEAELEFGNKDYAKCLFLFYYQLTKDRSIKDL